MFVLGKHGASILQVVFRDQFFLTDRRDVEKRVTGSEDQSFLEK
jgi:hypothetical protein